MRRLYCVAIAIGAGACGGDDASSPSAPGTATDGGSTATSDASSDGGDDGSTQGIDSSAGEQCNDLVQEGAFVTSVKSAPPAPARTGGTIVPGKYVITAVNAYTDSDAGGDSTALAATVVVSGNKFDTVSSIQGGATYRATSTFTTNGNQFTGTFVCYYPPLDGGVPSGSASQEFTAKPTELRTYLDFGALGILEYVYTKQ